MTLAAPSATTSFIRQGQLSASAIFRFDRLLVAPRLPGAVPAAAADEPDVRKRDRGSLVLVVQRRLPARCGRWRILVWLARRPGRPRAGDGGEHLLLLHLLASGIFRRDPRTSSAAAVPGWHGRRRHVAHGRGARLGSLVRCLAADDRRAARHVRQRGPGLRQQPRLLLAAHAGRLAVDAARLCVAAGAGDRRLGHRARIAPLAGCSTNSQRRAQTGHRRHRLSAAAPRSDAHRHRGRHDSRPRRLGRDAMADSLDQRRCRQSKSASDGPHRDHALRRRDDRRPDRRLARQSGWPANHLLPRQPLLARARTNTSTSP